MYPFNLRKNSIANKYVNSTLYKVIKVNLPLLFSVCVHNYIEMPRKSLRRQAIEVVAENVRKLRMRSNLRKILDEEDEAEDYLLFQQLATLNKMLNSRYIFRQSTNRKDRKKFDLEDTLSHDSKTINDDEFLFLFRITRDSFFLFLDEMKDKKAFIVTSNKSHQRPISFQLLVFLYRIGKEGVGGGSQNIAAYFGIGKGSVKNYVNRVVMALHEMKDEVVYWPDEDERMEMRRRLSALGFRHCVGIIDGTLVILDFRPESYHECYYSRKCFYALNVMIVCDDRSRVLYYNAGWPGSTHDNRVFRNSNLFIKRGEYFSHQEYLLGDSAYSSSTVMVQAFKKDVSHAELASDKEFFNTRLAQVRITSEHCIGILKGRFRCMKRNNIKLRKDKNDVKRLVDLIGACIIMHNLLIQYDENDIPEEWYDTMELNIDWTGYDEEEDDIPIVTVDNGDRRKYVYESVVNNFR